MRLISRFGLLRVREYAEGIALYRGEADELRHLTWCFSDIVSNWWAIMKKQKQLTWFRTGYNQAAVIFPLLVAAPQYFSRTFQVGELMQTASAFGQVQDALSWFVNTYIQLAESRATIDRLSSFYNATEHARLAVQKGQHSRCASGTAKLHGGAPAPRAAEKSTRASMTSARTEILQSNICSSWSKDERPFSALCDTLLASRDKGKHSIPNQNRKNFVEALK